MRIAMLVLVGAALVGCQSRQVKVGHVHARGCGHYFYHGEWNSEPHSPLCSVAYWHSAEGENAVKGPRQHSWDPIPQNSRLNVHRWNVSSNDAYRHTISVDVEPIGDHIRSVLMIAELADGSIVQLAQAPATSGEHIAFEEEIDRFNTAIVELRLIDNTGAIAARVRRKAFN